MKQMIPIPHRVARRDRGRIGATSAALLAMLLTAAAQSPAPQRWPATAVIRFDGTSTLHDFGGTIAAQPFVLTVVSNTWSATADVLAAQMDTASEGRDRNLHKMLDTNSHPRLRGSVSNAPVPLAGPTNATLRFQIRNQEHDLPVRVENWTETAERVQFHAAWEVSLKQYGLKPPSVLGVIRVGDKVRVEADVVADKTKPAPPVADSQP
jgi:polyisoprenoid-binding protein YceI